MAKMTHVLAEKFKKLPKEEPVDVVLELGDDAMAALGKADTKEEMRDTFKGFSAPVKDKIKLLGGDITGEGWLNGTLSARLTKSAVESLNDEPSVSRVDLPRILERD